ncbi:MAG: RNA polymerase sigma factor [Gemmataceae bacterium]
MNREELTALVRCHQAEIYRYLRYLGAVDAATAEDLVQETFLAALRSESPPPASEERRRAAWLRGIARNLFLAHCRKQRANPVRVDSSTLEQAEHLWATEFPRSNSIVDYQQALRQCLDKLADKPKQLLTMRYTQEKSRAEMARLLHMSENGIKSALQRVRAMLADCIQRHLRTETASSP